MSHATRRRSANAAPAAVPMGSSAAYQGHPRPLAPQHQPRDSSSWLAAPSRPSASWSPEDDAKLMSARQQGMNWQLVATRVFHGKTPNACRKRHERLMERANAEDWDGIKLELLAKEYMDARQQMWSVLGDRLNEKWTVIETKCMEKGYKNLAAAARSANRRSFGTDDSGIAMDDAERSKHRPQGTSHHKYSPSTNDSWGSDGSSTYSRPPVHVTMAPTMPVPHIIHPSQQQHQYQHHQRQHPQHLQHAVQHVQHHPQHQYNSMPPTMPHQQMYQHVQAPSVASLIHHPHMPSGPR